MTYSISRILLFAAFQASVSAVPGIVPEWSTVAPAPTAANSQAPTASPEPYYNGLGASILGPENIPMEQENIDLLASPSTDNGIISSTKWSFASSHNRLQSGGWARQQNVQNMPAATTMAGVNMRLEVGALRELHWHSVAEWSYVLSGCTMVTAVNTDGQVFSDTVCEGDIWYFPAGIPHSLQGTDADPNGTEFLLVFDSGSFSEDSTFQVTDWLAHVPKEVLAKNFGTDMSMFDHIPSKELYIFPAEAPSPGEQSPSSPAGEVPQPFTFHWSNINATQYPGGTAKIADTRSFPVSTTICAQFVTVEPGAMRELHWHPTEPEWTYFLSGNARMTLFASAAVANTVSYQAGDIAYIPPSYGHYVENTGSEQMTFLEIFNSDLVQDISLTQWLALTPPQIVEAHLGVSAAFLAGLPKEKQEVV